MRTRRTILAGLSGVVVLAGCAGQQADNSVDDADEEQGIDAPEPDTLQGKPILYHNHTYNLNGTAYTVPETLERGPQTITTDQQQIDAYISNEQFHEKAIAYRFTREDGTSISKDHHQPVENGINVEGDTIHIETNREQPDNRENTLEDEVMSIGGVCSAAVEDDETPYNFEVTINNHDGNTYTGNIDSETSQEYLDGDLGLLNYADTLVDDMGI
jgi:hypothetical protein